VCDEHDTVSHLSLAVHFTLLILLAFPPPDSHFHPLCLCLCLYQSPITFSALSQNFSRRTAASCFLEILQLKTWGVLEASQDESLGDIYIGIPV
jgi:hypothetical protein